MYTDYCTCFSEPVASGVNVVLYDEIKNKVITKILCSSQAEANLYMDEYVKNAPENVICERV